MNRDQLNRTGMMSAVSAYMDTNKSHRRHRDGFEHQHHGHQ